MDLLTEALGVGIYGAQAIVAVLGAFYSVVIWRRIMQSRFRSEEEQTEFMAQVHQLLSSGDYAGVEALCEGERRVLPQLIHMAILNRNLGYAKVRHLLADRFQRDVLSDIDYRLSWVTTVIKSAPMLGLFGTVGGMMGAFEELASGEKIDAANLAENISLALITTVIGLAIAIPLMLVVNAINVRVRKLEDLVGLGLTQFFEAFKPALERFR
jgi:biopolymer transport protein ExbB/TolQ